jgi:hypothetical protein
MFGLKMYAEGLFGSRSRYGSIKTDFKCKEDVQGRRLRLSRRGITWQALVNTVLGFLHLKWWEMC